MTLSEWNQESAMKTKVRKELKYGPLLGELAWGGWRPFWLTLGSCQGQNTENLETTDRFRPGGPNQKNTIFCIILPRVCPALRILFGPQSFHLQNGHNTAHLLHLGKDLRK